MKYSEKFTIVSQNLGYSGAPKKISPCMGGCIHDSNIWEFPDGERFFVKYAASEAKANMLAAERKSLELISRTESLRCPIPYFFSQLPGDKGAVLVMEWLDLRPLSSEVGARFAEDLAEMHQHTSSLHGFETDNFIGASVQMNQPSANWADFFWNHRLDAQLKLAQSKGYKFPSISALERSVRSVLIDHTPSPALLHGDLWGGNVGSLPCGTPVIYDPASYFGDPETDLAFTEVFGGFPPSFHLACSEIYGLNEGYELRKQVYNLYHYLNHLNLFGAGYLPSCERITEMLLCEYS